MRRCMNCMQEYDESHLFCPSCGYDPRMGERAMKKFPDALMPETILQGRFIVGCLRSYGEYDNLYVAWDMLLERKVIMREYFPSGTGRRGAGEAEISLKESKKEKYRYLFPDGRKAFEAEAQKLFRNQDISGVIPVMRIFREYGTTYQMTPYQDDYTLAQLLEEDYDLQPADVIRFMTVLCRIVDAIHERGMIHANLAPENIFISAEHTPLVFDFGQAKAEMQRMAGKRYELFNEQYTAPEILKGKEYTGSADIYSLGAIMESMLRRVRTDDRILLRKLREDAKTATAQQPEHRPVSAGEFSGLIRRSPNV